MAANPIQKTINQLLVGAFYRYHALLFGLVYLVMFGSVSGNVLISYHAQIIKSILTSPLLICITVLFWLFYCCHVLLYLKTKLHLPENFCLLQLNALPNSVFRKYLWQMVTLCLLPISTYALAIIVYGCIHLYLLSALIILVFLIAVHYFGVHLINKFFKNTELNFKILSHYKPWPIKIYWPSILYLKYIFAQQLLAFTLQKVISIMAIMFVFYSRSPTDEMRLPIVLYGLSILVCTPFVQKLILWLETQFVHHRALPIALYKRLFSIFLFCVLIMLPEHIMLYKTAPLHSSYAQSFALMAFGICFLFCQFGITYACKAILKNTYPYVGLCMVIIYFGALAESIWLINGILFAIGFMLLVTQFALFEAQPNEAETA